MRKLLLLLLVIPMAGFSQFKIALKGGLNFANVTDKAGINANSRRGYMIGGYISSKPKFFGFRSEIMLSRQGYDYSSNTNTGKVNLDYLLLPQLITLNFTKKVQLHAGLQAAFLLNANVDSTGNGSGSLFDYFNRFDYGVVAGGEIFPIGGFFIGARLNVSLHDVNKEEAPVGGNWPNYLPRLNVKNNVAQVYIGWRL